MKQISFFNKPQLSFGGKLSEGKRKARRVLCSKRATHLVLKANSHCLFQNKNSILPMIQLYGSRFGIRTYGISVQKDHLHLLVKIPSRNLYVRFIRSLTGILSRKLKVRWKTLPFTRVLQWGRDFHIALQYLRKNKEEVMGMRPYEIRKHRYK